MSKRYRVFISSTYGDLVGERTDLMWSLMSARYIPAGMESFPAADDRGWETITRDIDQCDYYVLVVAGRYGSIDEETDISWTHREYEYAREKGLSVLVFLRDQRWITADKMERKEDGRKRLGQFVELLERRHLYKLWTTSDNLKSLVLPALAEQIRRDQEAGSERAGWVRGQSAAPPSPSSEPAPLQSTSGTSSETGPKVAPADPSASGPSLALALLDSDDAQPEVHTPWRAVDVAPLGAPNTRIFTRAALLDAVRAMDFSVHVARELLIPPLHPSAAIRTDTGLVWREPASSAGDPNDRVLAIGLDGSVALRGFLWEAGRRNAPLAWGSDGLDIGTCVDEIVGVIAIADRLITHHERRPIRVRLRLKGIKGRHVAYSKAEDKFYPGGLRRSALESFETELKNLPVSASRAQITNLIDAVVRELNYLFDHIDQTYVRRRALERLKLALPQMAHRYPDGREIAREYVVVNDSRTLLTAHGTSSAESDVLVAVKFARDGEPFADLGLLDPDTQPPYWANLPDGVPPELAKRVAGLIAGDLAAQ